MRKSAFRCVAAFVVTLAPLALSGCCSTERADAAKAPTPTSEPAAAHAEHATAAAAAATAPAPMLATAHVMPTQGNTARGIVRFQQVDGGVHVTGEFEGLAPNGVHAIHLHECGDCSSPDGMSAGGHYNPEGHAHGAPDAATHHAGDFGNLNADADGKAKLDLTAKGLTVGGAVNPVIGRSVIVHAKPDDFVTQPTGNAGGRIGCGVIGVTKPVPPK